MLFTTVEELQAVLPAVHRQNSESLLAFAQVAELLHLVPVLGAGLVEQLGELAAGDAPARLLALREQLRRPLAYYAVLEAAPILAVTLNDAGATESTYAGSAPSRQWVYNNFVEATAANADKLLDLALGWLDRHAADYADELDSSEYRSRKRLLIGSAEELGRYVATAGSRRFFLALLPSLRQVEEFDIAELLGEDLLETLQEGLASGEPPSADTTKLLSLVRPVLAHRAIAQGILSMSVALTGSTMRVLSDNEAVRQRQALGPEEVSALSQQASSLAEKYRAKLASYLDARQPAPAATVSAELYDNAGKPSFWV
ncbi:MAG: DUF6712 family protein [Janthinobacterium lividum]